MLRINIVRLRNSLEECRICVCTEDEKYNLILGEYACIVYFYVMIMMYYPEAQDIIYIIVCRDEGETWRESRICGYEYYWNMSKEDSFNINGITQYTTQEELDKMLLTSDEDIVKAEYDNQGYIEAVNYTNKSGKDGIRIKYNYRINYSATEPYEKIITVSVRV